MAVFEGLSSAVEIEPGQFLNRSRLRSLLVEATPPDDLPSSSLYLKPAAATQLATMAAGGSPEAKEWGERLAPLGQAVWESDTGLVGLRASNQALAIIPPFPILENKVVDRWDAAPLLELLDADRTIGVVLLRLGRFSVAVYQGGKLVSSKTDARYVKGRHRAGGTSQRRFERIREGQMRRIYDKTCLAVRAQFEPYDRQLDHLLLGGERFTLNNFLKVCPYLERFQGKTLARRLNIRDPKRDTLEQVAELIWQSRVYPLSW